MCDIQPCTLKRTFRVFTVPRVCLASTSNHASGTSAVACLSNISCGTVRDGYAYVVRRTSLIDILLVMVCCTYYFVSVFVTIPSSVEYRSCFCPVVLLADVFYLLATTVDLDVYSTFYRHDLSVFIWDFRGRPPALLPSAVLCSRYVLFINTLNPGSV